MSMDRRALAAGMRLTLVVSQAEASPRTITELAGLAFAGGVSALQLREKRMEGREFYELARRLAVFCRERGRLFIVNDRLDIALAAGADGVHLGQGDLPAKAAREILGPGKILGVSAANRGEARAALEAWADYLGVVAMVATGSKTDAQVVKEDEIGPVLGTGLVTVAIGGVKKENAGRFWRLGFDGLAVISELTGAADPAGTARELLRGAPEN